MAAYVEVSIPISYFTFAIFWLGIGTLIGILVSRHLLDQPVESLESLPLSSTPTPSPSPTLQEIHQHFQDYMQETEEISQGEEETDN